MGHLCIDGNSHESTFAMSEPSGRNRGLQREFWADSIGSNLDSREPSCLACNVRKHERARVGKMARLKLK